MLRASLHFVKSVRIWSYSGLLKSCKNLNALIYLLALCLLGLHEQHINHFCFLKLIST